MTAAFDIAGKLQRAHDTAQRLHGDRYDEVAEPWREVLRAMMQAHNEDVASALRRALEPIGASGAVLILCAAAVDLMQEEVR